VAVVVSADATAVVHALNVAAVVIIGAAASFSLFSHDSELAQLLRHRRAHRALVEAEAVVVMHNGS
jgi:hypothetical protein